MNDTGLLARWRAWTPYLQGILRIVAGFTFLQFGTGKLLAFPGPLMPGGGTAPIGSLPGFAGLLEAIGGILVLLGLFTRPAAFIVSGEMAVAYFMAHAPSGFLWPALNQGTPAVLYCFIFLYLSAAGPGAWSVDGLRGKPGGV